MHFVIDTLNNSTPGPRMGAHLSEESFASGLAMSLSMWYKEEQGESVDNLLL